jgi:flagellar protein FlaJ
MSKNNAKERLERVIQRLGKTLHPLLSFLIKSLNEGSDKSESTSSTKLHVFAYRLLGQKTIGLMPLFRDVDVNLQRSRMSVSFRGYVNLAVLATMVVSFSTLVFVSVTTVVLLHLSVFFSILFGTGATLLAGASTIVGFYAYPVLRADGLKRSLDEELPFATGYLSILAGAGVSPAQMFRSLAQIDSSLAVSQEAKLIVRDVELFGVDVVSALSSASKRTPSGKFRELLEGFIATIHSGGDLARYLSERSKHYMRLKRIALKRFGDTLGVLAEFYVVMLVAGPLILVVMLAVMAMLGGGGVIGMFDPRLLLYLLTYLGIPVGSIVFLIMLDMITPKR